MITKKVSKFKIITVAIILVLSVVLAIRECNRPKNRYVDPVTVQDKPKPEIVYINDSLKAIKQELLLTNSKKTIALLQDSLQRLINKKANLSPEVIINYRDNLEMVNIIGTYKDSLSRLIDELLSKNQLIDSIHLVKDRLILTPATYTISKGKWLYQTGTIKKGGIITSDTLRILSEPLISFGETGGLFKRKTISATIGNKNPYFTADSANIYQYKPKQAIQLSMGPIVLTNGKSVHAGAGVTIKKGILSFTLGYGF